MQSSTLWWSGLLLWVSSQVILEFSLGVISVTLDIFSFFISSPCILLVKAVTVEMGCGPTAQKEKKRLRKELKMKEEKT